jgi:DNA polymerase-3 subunit epsilon
VIALFFDTETTGLKRQGSDFVPGLVQLAAILQDTDSGRILAEVNYMVRQEGKPIPTEVTAIHGITTDLADLYGIPLNVADRLFRDLITKADLLVAHNIDFDLDVMADNLPLSLANFKVLELPTFCTMDSSLYIVKAPRSAKQKDYFTSKGIKPDTPYKVPSLAEAHSHFFDREIIGAHDAMVDVRACRDIFLQLIIDGWYKVESGLMVPTPDLEKEIKATKA